MYSKIKGQLHELTGAVWDSIMGAGRFYPPGMFYVLLKERKKD